MMKTKIAMVISIAGVLVAGSAAALVNTQVLGGSTSAASPLVIDNGSPAQDISPVTVATTVNTPVAVVPTPVAAAAPAATQAVYAIGEAGTVTLDTAGDMLTIVAVTPTDPWIVTKSETQDSTDVEIRFQNGTTEVEFHANLLFGVVTTAVESHDSSAPSDSTSNSVDNSGSGRHSGGDDNSSHGGGGDDD
ncbi:MAG: hypothetical protein ABI706_15945 [Ilumatobacteraceae bacterium]